MLQNDKLMTLKKNDADILIQESVTFSLQNVVHWETSYTLVLIKSF